MHAINMFTVEFILHVFDMKICLFYTLYFYYSLYNTRSNISFNFEDVINEYMRTIEKLSFPQLEQNERQKNTAYI